MKERRNNGWAVGDKTNKYIMYNATVRGKDACRGDNVKRYVTTIEIKLSIM